MRIKKLSIAIAAPAVLISVLLAAVAFTGCKDKAEDQTAVSGSAAVQQKEEEAPVPKESQSDEPSIVTPGVTGNYPPKITSLKISPEIPVRENVLTAEAKTFDQDGDAVSVIYEWSKNDALLSESTKTLRITDEFKRGDTITLKATPNDGERGGSSVSMVLNIANAHPVIHPSQSTLRFDGTRYSYQIKASDADRDPLIYSLNSGPSGMTVNPATGEVKWMVPPEFEGKALVTVSVADGHGGETLQSFSLDINREE